jgi:hypothetical protein
LRAGNNIGCTVQGALKVAVELIESKPSMGKFWKERLYPMMNVPYCTDKWDRARQFVLIEIPKKADI